MLKEKIIAGNSGELMERRKNGRIGVIDIML